MLYQRCLFCGKITYNPLQLNNLDLCNNCFETFNRLLNSGTLEQLINYYFPEEYQLLTVIIGQEDFTECHILIGLPQYDIFKITETNYLKRCEILLQCCYQYMQQLFEDPKNIFISICDCVMVENTLPAQSLFFNKKICKNSVIIEQNTI